MSDIKSANESQDAKQESFYDDVRVSVRRAVDDMSNININRRNSSLLEKQNYNQDGLRIIGFSIRKSAE